jgi:hypothetical protein
MNHSTRNQLDCLDRMNASLARPLLELRFIASLLDEVPSHPVQVESDAILAVVARIIRELEATQSIVRQAFQQYTDNQALRVSQRRPR